MGPSQSVVELVNGKGEIVALFFYKKEGKVLRKLQTDIGELHIMKGPIRDQEEAVCSALAMVERVRREAVHRVNTSKEHEQGRVRII